MTGRALTSSPRAAIGAPEWEAFDLGLYAPTTLLHTAGQSVTQEVVLHLPTSIEEAGTGTTYAVADWSGLEVTGMPAGLAFDNLIGSIFEIPNMFDLLRRSHHGWHV